MGDRRGQKLDTAASCVWPELVGAKLTSLVFPEGGRGLLRRDPLLAQRVERPSPTAEAVCPFITEQRCSLCWSPAQPLMLQEGEPRPRCVCWGGGVSCPGKSRRVAPSGGSSL